MTHPTPPSGSQEGSKSDTPIADELCGMYHISVGSDREARFAKAVAKVADLERALAAREPTVTCEKCAFRYGAEHVLAGGDGTSSCPVCELAAREPSAAHILVEKQANDQGLWFDADTLPEQYLQNALRQLHAAVEHRSALQASPSPEPNAAPSALAEEIERALNVLEPLCKTDYLFIAPNAAPGCELRISTLRNAVAALRQPEGMRIKPTHEAADAFWHYWKAYGETHIHGYYESTWGAINAALAAAAKPSEPK